jgi:putative hydrolase of the HAD superfamily
MKQITAIGFDLFNTLITVNPDALPEATSRLVRHLGSSGFTFEERPFIEAYRGAAFRFLEESKQNGIETHNSIWISAALASQGLDIPAEDPRIWKAVDDYFTAFYEKGRRIPGTRDMLSTLKKDYALALLSNFTHAPAAMEILDRLSLTPFFDTVLISGDLGYRKPFPMVFDRLVEGLGSPREQILFIGDDPEADIGGALQAGLHPAWMTYVRDHNLPFLPYTQSEQEKMPELQVPRISTWNDLFTLLQAPGA